MDQKQLLNLETAGSTSWIGLFGTEDVVCLFFDVVCVRKSFRLVSSFGLQINGRGHEK